MNNRTIELRPIETVRGVMYVDANGDLADYTPTLGLFKSKARRQVEEEFPILQANLADAERQLTQQSSQLKNLADALARSQAKEKALSQNVSNIKDSPGSINWLRLGIAAVGGGILGFVGAKLIGGAS